MINAFCTLRANDKLVEIDMRSHHSLTRCHSCTPEGCTGDHSSFAAL